MNYRPASNAELFNINEKDERYHRQWIEDDFQEIAQRCLGVRKWVQFRNALTVLSRFGYFAINTLTNNPTLGEEFCEAKVGSQSLLQKLATILLNNDLELPKEVPRPLVNLIKDVHLITFYFFGDFYEISKRLTGVNYVCPKFDEQGNNNKWSVMNKLVGCMSIVKLILNLHKQAELLGQSQETNITTDTKQQDNPSDKALEVVHPDVVCQLCSSKRTQPTSTLCGHIFCWNCIHEWLKGRSECPICRAPTEPSRLIHLINFR